MHFLIVILLIVILYLVFNKKENYDDVQVNSLTQLSQDQPQMVSQDQPQMSSEMSPRDKIISDINIATNTIKYLRFMLGDETNTDKIKDINKQIIETNLLVDKLKNDLLQVNSML